MSTNIDWCKRLRGLASGEITGEIPSIEYSLAADHIEVLQNCIELVILAYETGGITASEIVALIGITNYDE
jgi:hypothetical protein